MGWTAETRGETTHAEAWRQHAPALRTALGQEDWMRLVLSRLLRRHTPVGSAASTECRACLPKQGSLWIPLLDLCPNLCYDPPFESVVHTFYKKEKEPREQAEEESDENHYYCLINTM